MLEPRKTVSEQKQNNSNLKLLSDLLGVSEPENQQTINQTSDTSHSLERATDEHFTQNTQYNKYLNPPINQLITEGLFTVDAASQKGTFLKNYSSVEQKIMIRAVGKWIIKTDEDNCDMYPPQGKGELADNHYLSPESRIGSLLIYNDTYQQVIFSPNTNSSEITIPPMQLIGFVCNYHKEWYRDNRGEITIKWSLKKD